MNAFYLASEKTFKEMADKTNGKCEFFKISSNKASDQLTGFLVMNILRLIE